MRRKNDTARVPTFQCRQCRFRRNDGTVEIPTSVWKKFVDRHRYKSIYRYLNILHPTLDGIVVHTLSEAQLADEEAHDTYYLVKLKYRRINTVSPTPYLPQIAMWP